MNSLGILTRIQVANRPKPARQSDPTVTTLRDVNPAITEPIARKTKSVPNFGFQTYSI